MILKYPISIWFINTGTSVYIDIANDHKYFNLVNKPEQADIIVFENDDPAFIRANPLFKKCPEKCVAVTWGDLPSYFLPGCYSSNSKGILSYGRAQTITYMRSEREAVNPYVKKADSGYDYLYAFRGGATSWVRKKLFKNKPVHNDVLIEDSNNYNHWSAVDSFLQVKPTLQQEYATLINKSLFFLCPRGAGSGSIRLFEVMKSGRVPVIISDKWIPIEKFDWDEFSLRIAEKDILNIDNIIRQREPDGEKMGEKALEVYNNYFAPGPDLAILADALISIQNNRSEFKERIIRSVFPLLENSRQIKRKGYNLLKFSILKIYSLTGRQFPYSLNRSIEDQLSNKSKN